MRNDWDINLIKYILFYFILVDVTLYTMQFINGYNTYIVHQLSYHPVPLSSLFIQWSVCIVQLQFKSIVESEDQWELVNQLDAKTFKPGIAFQSYTGLA